ncbi:MAG: uroporphyrinogen-III synthase [Caldilineaceae bacterium]|nr:uroporphyrinogen-III synthase [Caldilineaceae bacterium]
MADRPLSGLRVVNTRAQHQAQALTELLEAQGAEVLHYPAISIEPIRNNPELDQALHAAVDGAYEWIVLTSSNTVHALVERLSELGFDPKALSVARIAAVGPSTADAIRAELGLDVALLPDEFVAESLAEAIPVQPGERVFLPQSDIARSILAEKLEEAGAQVTRIDAYRTVLGRGGVPLPEYFWRGDVDAVLFTSASTVHNFMRRLKRENGSGGMLVDVVVGCIGPVTADAAIAHDLPVKVVPDEHTIEGLVTALAAYFAERTR